MADMIKFFKGLEANLPASGVNGALYITTDEGAIYLGTGSGMKRLGDFVQTANVASLPEKAHESCLYYCVAENILAKWNGSEWKQINKQPTAEELKGLLGLGSIAYLSEISESNLDASLKEKVNAAAEGNHSHSNKTVIDGITAEKVAAWDAAEGNAKGYADGLNTAMNTRVEALEAIDHEHANKDLLDTYTQTEANLADAVAKKHAHTFNETELNKIAEGDVAKWNGVVADHLTSEDKTTLENAIKEAKKAGTDANTNIETYKVTNDARVKAVEDDIAEIVDGTDGILAQAKSYSDGKLATAKSEISAEIDADIKVVADDLAGYKASNNEALAGVKATAEAAAVKTEVESALAGKVDKVEGKSLIADSEIERLLTLANYDDTQVKADIAKKADAETMTTELGKKVDKVTGYSLVSDAEIERLATLKNYDDTALAGRMTTAEGKIAGLETESAKHALKTEVEAVDAKFANYKTAEAQKAIDDEQNRRLGVIEGDYLKAADIANFETKENVKKVTDDLAAYVESNNAAVADRYTKTEADGKFALKGADAYDDAEVRGLISDNADAIATEKSRAEGIESGLRTDVDAIKADYLKASDKTELEGKITAEENRAKGVEESLQTQINTIMSNPDAEGAINSINEFTQYVKDHGTIAEGFRTDIDKNKEDIAANAKAIADQATSDAATYETKTDATAKLTEAKGYTDTTVAAEKTAREAKEAELAAAIEAAKTEASNQDAVVLAEAQKYADQVEVDANAYTDGKVSALKTELQGEIDADVKVVNDALEAYKISNNAEVAKKANSADVYTKTETFTKEEVAAAIAAAIETAHTWGEF